jgi:hypothetical protein
MVSRTTDDYRRMAQAGCVAITEPAFWAGFDRCSVDGFRDYYRQLTDTEPKRAARYGIQHHCWLCINPKEAEDVGFAEEVMSIIPDFLDCDNVLGIGEIGLNKNSRNELQVLEAHLNLAKALDTLVLVHTPHLEDKFKGTMLILDAVDNAGLDPDRVLIDHVEEHTVGPVLDRGFWAGMTLYPDSKCTPQRAIDILERWGTDRIWMNSAGDWGDSDPLAVPKARMEMLRRHHSAQAVRKVTFDNPLAFLERSPKFRITP